MLFLQESGSKALVALLCVFPLFGAIADAEAQANRQPYPVSQQISPFWKFVVHPDHPGCEFLSPTRYTGVMIIDEKPVNMDFALLRPGLNGQTCSGHVSPIPINKSNILKNKGNMVYFLISDVQVVSPRVLRIRSGDRICLIEDDGKLFTFVLGDNPRHLAGGRAGGKRCISI
jgi:hypothetical protein